MSPQLEQLLFGSVDRVVDGVESSGWQVIARSDGMEESTADELVRWIEPELAPLKPLSGFPTEEEVLAADRRLVHRVVSGVPVLFHTAPAGQDTTGRPNSMTHVVIDHSANTARPLLGPSAWRAPWWCTPFGAAQMKLAALPAPTGVRPGTSVTEDSMLAQVLQPGASGILGQLADVVSVNAEVTDEAQHRVAVLLIDRVDDAAQWLGALLGCTAPEAARAVSWSTLERVHGDRDLERLCRGGLDIAAVPRGDLGADPIIPAGCVVIDPSRPTEGTPATPFGRFVAAMASDPGLWLTAREAITRDVLNQLVDHTEVPLAWPVAMAQARTWSMRGDDAEVLFSTSYPGDLRSDVESVLLRASVPALDEPLPGTAEDLRAAKEELIGEPGQRSAQGWRELCQRIGDGLAPARALLLGHRYLAAAVLDQVWLMQARAGVTPLPDPVRTALTEWSSHRENAAAVDELLRTARRTLDEQPPPRDPALSALSPGVVRGRLVAGLLEDGIVVDPAAIDELLSPIAREILGVDATLAEPLVPPQQHLDLIASLPAKAREALAEQVERGIAGRATHEAQTQGTVRQPTLTSLLSLALTGSDADADRPWLSLNSAIGAVATGAGSTSAMLAALVEPARLAQQIPAVLHLEPSASMAVEASFRAEDLPALSGLAVGGIPQASRWMLVAALGDIDDERSWEMLRVRRRGTPTISEAKREPLTAPSWEDSAVLLAEAIASPFLSDRLTAGSTWIWAENAHAAAVQLREGVGGLQESQQLRAKLEELARRGELRSAATLVLLSAGSRRFRLHAVRNPVDLDALIEAASRDPRGLLAPCAPSWGRAGLDALRTIAADTSMAPAAQPPSPLSPTSAPSGGAPAQHLWEAETALRGAATAVLDARLRGAPAADVPRLVDEARAEFRGDNQGWARAQRAVPSLEESLSSRVERLGDIVKKNLNLLSWQRKEGRDG